MRWVIEPEFRNLDSITWIREYTSKYDLSRVLWTTINKGRGFYGGVYGRTHYPTKRFPHYRISCQIPGPFPLTTHIRKSPVYMNSDGTYPSSGLNECPCHANEFVERNGTKWRRVYTLQNINDADEAIVFIIGHEYFHFLRNSRQIPGRNTEAQADVHGELLLDMWRDKNA